MLTPEGEDLQARGVSSYPTRRLVLSTRVGWEGVGQGEKIKA